MVNVVVDIASLLSLLAWSVCLTVALVFAVLVLIELGRRLSRALWSAIRNAPGGTLARADAQFHRDMGIKL